MNDDSTIYGIEYRHATHIRATSNNKDALVVKEVIHYKDGTTKPNIRILYDYRRPYWITKPINRVHKQKKEFEHEDKLDKFLSTESNLANAIALRLGKTGYNRNNLRDVRDSPYVYGIDTSVLEHLKKDYESKYPEDFIPTENKVCTLDIEADIDTGDITIITLTIGDEIFTVATPKIHRNNKNFADDVTKTLLENMPEIDSKIVEFDKSKLKINVLRASNEQHLIYSAFEKIHAWKPDILSIWNVTYDILKIEERSKLLGIDVDELFSDPSVPEELRRFKFKMGKDSRLTESGKYKPLGFHERWHTIYTPASYVVIDAMCSHYFLRLHLPTLNGGYGLDNVLNNFLNVGKLHLSVGEGLDKVTFHKEISKKYPILYTVYNQWDSLSMNLYDRKTQDLSVSIKVLSQDSSYDKFASGPRRIVDEMFFYALKERRLVMGCKPTTIESLGLLSRKKWILTLKTYLITEIGLNVIEEMPWYKTNIRAHTLDNDAVSSYPSNTVVSNLSKDTTVREITKVIDVPLVTFKYNNINLMFGPVNALRYVEEMHRLETLDELGITYDKMFT